MRQKIIWLSLSVLVLAIAVAVGVSAGGGDPNPIMIGVVYNTSGGMKWLDEPSLEGLVLGADEINAGGGVLGRDLEVVAVDGTTDTTEMTRLAADLAAREDIVAITGVNEPLHAVAPVRATLKRATGGLLTFSHSELALAVGSVIQGRDLPFVTTGSTLAGLPEMIGDDAFAVAASSEDGAAAIARFAWDHLGARAAWVLVDEESDYAETLAASFEEKWAALGGEISSDTFAPGAAIQIPDQIERLTNLADKPDVLFIASLQNDGGYLLDQLREARVAQPVLFADVVDPRYIEAMGSEMDNVFMSTHGSFTDPDQDLQDFVAAYRAKFGRVPESASAMLGYDAIRLIADALERAGSAERGALSESLAATIDFAGITGTLSYVEGLQPDKPITIVGYQGGDPAVVAKISHNAAQNG